MDSELGAGPIGLLIVLLIGATTVLLVLNMNRRLRRMPRSFDRDEEPGQDRDLPPDNPTRTPPS